MTEWEWDSIADKYDGMYQAAKELREDRLTRKALRRIIAPGASVLDLGCGTGWVLENVPLGDGWEGRYVGIDISAKMLECAQKKFPQATFVHGPMSRLVVWSKV